MAKKRITRPRTRTAVKKTRATHFGSMRLTLCGRSHVAHASREPAQVTCSMCDTLVKRGLSAHFGPDEEE